MFVRVPMPVREGLYAVGTGLLALALAACSQTAEPETVVETPSPEAGALVATETKPVKPAPLKPVTLVTKPTAETKPVESTPAPPPTFRPVEMTPFVPSAPGKRISRVNVPGPYVAVTFDDGPSASLTPQVLDIFNRHGARATFFVQGQNANRNRNLLARMAAEGHEVASHTWSHINMRASSMDKIFRELDRTAEVIEEATGSRPKVMRPPYGSVNPGLINTVYQRYGTPAILWDVDTNDWRKPGVETVIRRAVGNAKPGSIILLHDIHPSTIAAVEGIVTGLQARGFKLVTVSQLIAMGRRAAGATAPARTPETPAAEPLPPVATSPELPAAPAEAHTPAVTMQPQQPLPVVSLPLADAPGMGAASIGVAPAPVEPQEATAPAETTTPQEMPASSSPVTSTDGYSLSHD